MTTSLDDSARDRGRPFQLGTEQRFPLDLTARTPLQWEAYETALREAWDPEDERLWADFDPAIHSAPDRAAGALVWSHRAWVEYPAIAESEAVLIRACLEPGVEIDLKYCLSMRAVERARSTDLAHIMATRLHAYEAGPATVELAALLDDELVRRVLHSDSDLDVYIAAHIAVQATIDLRMWEQAAVHSEAPLAQLIALVTRDKARMLEVAWRRLGQVFPNRAEAERRLVADAVLLVLVDEELRGRQVPALLNDGADRTRLLMAHEQASKSGLGGIPPTEQLEVADAALGEAAGRLAEHGVHIEMPPVRSK
jgi:hypothetical protein